MNHETISELLPENEPVKIECPDCNEWYLHNGDCDWCGYKTYKLENENGTSDDRRLLRLQSNQEKRQDLDFG